MNFLKSHHYLFDRNIKILLYFKCTLVLKCFDCVLSSVDVTSFDMYLVSASYHFH